MNKYTNLQRFTRDVIHPVVIAIKYWILSCSDKILSDLNTLKSDITSNFQTLKDLIVSARLELISYIYALISLFNSKYQTLDQNLVSHVGRTDNPHNVKLNQVATIANATPLNNQGVQGDMWINHGTPMSYSFVTGEWSPCSVPCGGGTQSRSVQCVRSDGAIVLDSLCLNLGMTKPISIQDCNLQPCIVPVDVSFYVANDNRGEMFRSDANLVKGASLGGSWSTGDGVYDNVYGPNIITFTPGVPVYFCSEGYNTNDAGGASMIFTNVLASRFTFNLLRVDAGPTPVWRTDLNWQYNPSLGSRGFLRITANNIQWKWFFSLTLNN